MLGDGTVQKGMLLLLELVYVLVCTNVLGGRCVLR